MKALSRLLATGFSLALPLLCHAVETLQSFQAGDGGWQLAAPAVGNIDDDAELEIVVAYRNSEGVWFVDAYDYSGARVPGFPFPGGTTPMNLSPTLQDLDGDGINEILFTRGNEIIALKGNGSIFWRQSITPANYIPDAGFQAVTNGFYLTTGLPLLSPTLPLTAEFFSEVSPPLIADVDNDGSLEVITAWKIDPDKLSALQDFNPFINDVFGLQEWGATGEVWSGGVVLSDARTGATKFTYHFHQLVEAGVALAQLDDDPALEVLVLNDADSVVAFDKTKPPGLFGKGMLHKKFGKNLRLLSGSYLTGVDLAAADIDGDGLDETLVSSSPIEPNWQPSETMLDDDGTVLWREWNRKTPVQSAWGWFNSATLIPCNPDHDNHVDVLGFNQTAEITFRYWDGVNLVSHPGWPKIFGKYLPTPPVVGDVDGDGFEEIIIGTYDPAANPSSGALFVYSLGGEEKFRVTVPGGLKHVPSIADVNGDGKNEVIYRALDGRVYIQNFGGGSPANVSWATHRGNSKRDGNFGRDLYPAGTPRITSRGGTYKKTAFTWSIPAGLTPSTISVYRSTAAAGPYNGIATLPGDAREFTDENLIIGTPLFYEVRAQYGGTIVASAPFMITPDWNNNLLLNGGFEQNDNSHWDKWFTGDISWTNMTVSTVEPQAGRQSMEVRLRNDTSGSSITQYSHYGVPEDYIRVTPGKWYSFGGFIRTAQMNSPTEQWLEWDSSRTGENTNARPALPWPNYFTPALKAPAGDTPWTYMNRVFQMPEGFPNVELRHRYSVPQTGSGSVFLDGLFFRELPPPDSDSWAHLIPLRSSWKYLASPAPEAWTAPGFNDGAWSEAPAKFGQGSGPHNIATALPKNQPAYYFRKQFNVPAGSYEELIIAATCTDDYAGIVHPLRIWLNGTEVSSSGIEAVTGEGNIVKHFDLSPFLELLRPGQQNTLAVMLQNTWQPTWDNVAFDLSLRAISGSNGAPKINSVQRRADGSVSLLVSGSPGTTWTLQSSDENNISNWRMVDQFTIPASGVVTLEDRGQNNRPSPGSVPVRFYRLIR